MQSGTGDLKDKKKKVQLEYFVIIENSDYLVSSGDKP